ncbi:unnamed protein product [Caretta caretta]
MDIYDAIACCWTSVIRTSEHFRDKTLIPKEVGRIYHSSQFSIIRKFAESAIHTILQIIYEDDHMSIEDEHCSSWVATNRSIARLCLAEEQWAHAGHSAGAYNRRPQLPRFQAQPSANTNRASAQVLICRIYHSSQFSIIRKFAESAIHTILQIIYEDDHMSIEDEHCSSWVATNRSIARLCLAEEQWAHAGHSAGAYNRRLQLPRFQAQPSANTNRASAQVLICRIYHSSQFSIIRKFAESAIHTILQIIYEDIEQNRPQDRPLGHST